MKQTNIINWQKILQKMEKHIHKLSPRPLSLRGKTTLLNILILAKAACLSNVFPIPDEVLTKIHIIKYNILNTLIFKYMWQNKKVEPIARKTIFLPKPKGGLNIKEPKTHNLGMRLKHL